MENLNYVGTHSLIEMWNRVNRQRRFLSFSTPSQASRSQINCWNISENARWCIQTEMNNNINDPLTIVYETPRAAVKHNSKAYPTGCSFSHGKLEFSNQTNCMFFHDFSGYFSLKSVSRLHELKWMKQILFTETSMDEAINRWTYYWC